MELLPSDRASGIRAAVAVLSLVVLAASLTRPLRPADTRMRWHRLLGAARGDILPSKAATGFWFDPDYAAFLDDVKRLTPQGATIAVLVPRRPDLYVYQASYQLAPRRIVEERWKDDASFVATYRTEAARGPGGLPIAHGKLWKK